MTVARDIASEWKMRFTETGPDIPDDLLFARDQGKVVFFCGAGVSFAKAKLSDFLKLAGKVLDDMGSLPDSPARRLYNSANAAIARGEKSYVPVDRMFSALDQEFDPVEVRESVARALKPDAAADLEAHRVLLDLSKGSDGRPRLVTTNFDLLFEAAGGGKTSGPANLPSPERPADFEGVIHLHGSTNADYTGIEGGNAVVLSSNEFGKAYLSEGWATQYIRHLKRHFKIVFVGYSAEDPPVQYLLEALRDENVDGSSMYAFQRGDVVSALEQWSQKGVTPISFGDRYEDLWDTLSAWSERARDVGGWYEATAKVAAEGPSATTPTFRGRIAHLASSTTGIKSLNAAGLLPSTWLYALDPSIRYLNPVRADWSDPTSSVFDPFEHFGLDRDMAPPPPDPDNYYDKRKTPENSWNAFVGRPQDHAENSKPAFGSVYGYAPLNDRIWELSRVLYGNLDQTPALWWAAGIGDMHPNIVSRIDSPPGDTGVLSKYWRYLVSTWRRSQHANSLRAHEIREKAEREGWSRSLIREAVDLARPYISVRRAHAIKPPTDLRADPSRVIALDVEYPRIHLDFEFPAESLPFVLGLMRSSLLEAEELEREIDAYSKRCPTPTFRPSVSHEIAH
jgi:hypothetical protein